LEKLGGLGVNVPELVQSDTAGVIITDFLAHTPLKIELQNGAYEEAVGLLAKTLGTVHKFGAHGEPVVDNCFICGGKGYFADFERFNAHASIAELTKDLEKFIYSVFQITRKPIQEIECLVLRSYKDEAIKSAYNRRKKK